MNLRGASRAAIESSRPALLQTEDKESLVRCLDSYSLWVKNSDVSLTPCLVQTGYWESWITSWFCNNVNEGDTVVDVGANCGYFTMLFDRLVGTTGRVIAYEASSSYAELLRRTKNTNVSNFDIVNKALADEPGVLTLTYPGEYTGSASIAHGFDSKWGEPKSEVVEASTLDIEFGASLTPALIKIDAESAEEMIWNGGQQLLGRPDAPVVVLEYSPTGVYSNDFPDRLFEYGHVTGIGYDGQEHTIDSNFLRSLRDWYMIVIRKR